MTDKYYRLVTVIVNICPDPLRELFLKHARADQNPGTPYTTLDCYLNFRKKEVQKLVRKKLLRKDQLDILFPTNGQTDITSWDLTLLVLVVKEMFGPQLNPTDLQYMSNIRDIRNNLQHISGTGKVTDQDFMTLSNKLIKQTCYLAKSAKGRIYEDEINGRLDKVLNSVLEDLGDVLRYWYTNQIHQLKDEIIQLKEQIESVQETAKGTKKILKKSTVKRERSGGKMIKRLRVADDIVENMRERFISWKTNGLQGDFQPPKEVDDITSELQANHLVVVSGFGRSLYQQAALCAIQRLDYNEQRCVVVTSPSHWCHIDDKEVELAVFLHPFGKRTFEEDKAKAMYGIFDSLKDSASSEDEGEIVDVVIITDNTILTECKKRYSHEVIESQVAVYKPTTQDTPVDLVEAGSAVYQVDNDPHYKNLLVQSIAYCKHHRMQLLDDDLKEDALELFRSKKVIVISGPRGSGKTTLALSLLASYQEGHYLILTEPGDLRYIRFGVTCVVVIEDLGGKFSFEIPVVQKWLRKFDMLFSAVKDGKLNVIITCVPDKLNEYIVDTAKHPMLEAVFQLPEKRVVKIKQEPILGTHEDGRAGINFPKRVKHQNTTTFTRVKTINSNEIDIPDSHLAKRLCQHPNGSFLVLTVAFDNDTETDDDSDTETDTPSWVLYHFDADFQYIRQYNTNLSYYWRDEDYYDICCTDSGDVVITAGDIVSLYRITNETLQVITSTTQYDETYAQLSYMRLHSFKNRIYMCCGSGELFILDSHLNEKKKHELMYPKKYYDYQCVVPCLGQTFFYIDEENPYIICEYPKQKQLKFLQEEGFRPRFICAASEDSVFVLGRQLWKDDRILQVNTDMEIISDILLEDSVSDGFVAARTVFDKVNARLVMYDGETQFKQIYLE